ncbi:hypothetical protein [Streptomyces sp. NPDC127040]|uniref:hypothetical protein n=1 Tax=Streptomyces sp. NPDC127040 TaxID=3347116 RepID=UPI00364BD62F
MPAIDAGISVATGGTCLGAAGVLYVADRLPWIGQFAAKVKSPQVQTILVLTASIGLVSTPLGQLLNRGVTTVNGLLAGTVGAYTGVSLAGALAIAAILWLVSDFMAGVKTRTLILAAVTPILCVMIPGVIGGFLAGVLGFIATQVGTGVAWLMGA